MKKALDKRKRMWYSESPLRREREAWAKAKCTL